MNTIRKVLIATAFSATVAGALTGAAMSGESAEIESATNCAAAHWPLIPAECLENAPIRDVRLATANLEISGLSLQERFEVAFK